MADVVRICTRADLGSCVVGLTVLAIASTEKAVLALRFVFALGSVTAKGTEIDWWRSIFAASCWLELSNDYAMICVESLVVWRSSRAMHDPTHFAEDASCEAETTITRVANTN